MQRITISLDDDLLEAIDALASSRGYTSRSEALRDMVRSAVNAGHSGLDDAAPCVATLSYVFEHETRDLARRLTRGQHNHHAISISTLHVHLDDVDCLEVSVLKGPAGAVRAYGDGVTSQRGVRFGNLHVMPARTHDDHPHDAGG